MTGFQLLRVNNDGCHMWGQEMFTLSATPDSHPFIIYIYSKTRIYRSPRDLSKYFDIWVIFKLRDNSGLVILPK